VDAYALPRWEKGKASHGARNAKKKAARIVPERRNHQREGEKRARKETQIGGHNSLRSREEGGVTATLRFPVINREKESHRPGSEESSVTSVEKYGIAGIVRKKNRR